MQGSCRIALVYRGNRDLRDLARIDNPRLASVAAALSAVGLTGEPAVFAEEFADEVRDQLAQVQGVLVWVDPITGNDDRETLDDILRQVASGGVWVSAHPDVILKMGTKEVLYQTRELGWGSDILLYRTAADFDDAFPSSLATGGARVLKQYLGNGGIGVWKVELIAAQPGLPLPGPVAAVHVQSARSRNDVVEDMSLGTFMDRCHKYFGYSGGQGRLIDQPFQPRVTEGLIRCYLVKGEVVGFSRQYPSGRSPAELKASGGVGCSPPDRVFGLPAAKTMYGPEEATFQTLRRNVEREWVPAMQALVDVDSTALPALWDADFLFGTKTADGEDTYVLMEINVSAVAPFPEQALPKVAQAVLSAVQARG